MSFLNTLREYARRRSTGRRRLSNYLYVAELPSDIRKDIGWRLTPEDSPPTRH